MHRTGGLHALALALTITACGEGSGGAPDATPRPAWRGDLPPAAEMGARRGLVPARGIIHLHSPYSHDACDGEPRDEDTGAIDEACLADLRAALCRTRMDYAALTDHDASMAGEPFEDLFLVRGDDELVRDGGGAPIASRLACDDGHRVLLTVGGENPIMPIMLDRHVDGDAAERAATYDGDDPDAVAAFRAAGATVWIPHTESRTTEELAALAPDGIEIYQLHANLDPDIRVDHLGLDSSGAIEAVLQFADTSPEGPEPDLAMLSFLLPSEPALARWDDLLGTGRRVAGSGGTDAHQNVFDLQLRDGERGDSYRRMLRWFTNVVLVADPADPVALEAAIRAGRMFVAFEIMGTPIGFDARAVAGGATAAELGDTVAASAGATLEVTLPAVWALDPSLPAPAIAGRILRIDAGGRTLVAEGAGPTLTAPLDAPGAYRVEVTIQPRHLGPYLGNLGTAYAEQTHPWIYASPIYVE